MTRDEELVGFLQWALPRLGLRWRGYRKVRRQVGRRLRRRLADLGLADLDAYRRHLEAEPDEWRHLDPLCRITISRFFRDRGVFDRLADELVPALAAGKEVVRAWSAGCAGGEEPYSLVLMWEVGRVAPGVALDLQATDADAAMLERARAAVYDRGSLRELPLGWTELAFTAAGNRLALLPRLRRLATFRQQDIRLDAPPGMFQIVLCRNLALTYFDRATQQRAVERIAGALEVGGALVLGGHERLPPATSGFERWFPGLDLPLYRRRVG